MTFMYADASGVPSKSEISKQDWIDNGAPYFDLTEPTKAIDILAAMFGHSKSDMRRNKRKFTIGGLDADLDEEIEPGNVAVVVVYGKERGMLF